VRLVPQQLPKVREFEVRLKVKLEILRLFPDAENIEFSN